METRALSTDIFIIGGGLAALRAAERAAQSGLQVTLAIKDEMKSSSGITGFNAVLPGSSHNDTCSTYFDDTVTGGCHLNNAELVACLTYYTESTVQDLINMGVRFDTRDGRLALRQAAGSTVPRLVHYKDRIGTEIMEVLTKRLKACSNVRLLDHTLVTRLVKENGMVRGAFAVDTQSGDPLAVSASATVIATGGMGNLYAFTSAPRSITGDGYVLAKSVGARLRDMEFVQFEPFSLLSPAAIRGFNIPTAMLWDGAVLTNRYGEEFIPRDENGRTVPMSKGDLCRKMMQEVRAGRGSEQGGVYFQIGHLPDAILADYPGVLELFRGQGLYPSQRPVEVAPAYHYMMGGIEIDKNCNTRVPGLMAVGEVTGGVHGAGRLSGNSGSETLVFGAIAGEEVVRNAKKWHTTQLDAKIVRGLLEQYRDELSGEESGDLAEISAHINNVMQEKAAVLREGRLLSEAQADIKSIVKELKGRKAHDLKSYIELSAIKNTAEVAEYVIKGALTRTESRGDHARLDFPERDDLNFLKSITI